MSGRNSLEPIRKDPNINKSSTNAYHDKNNFHYINLDRYTNMVVNPAVTRKQNK